MPVMAVEVETQSGASRFDRAAPSIFFCNLPFNRPRRTPAILFILFIQMQQPACTDPWTLSAKPADDVPVESDVTTSTGQPRPVVSSLQPAHRVPVKSRPTASPSLQRQLLKDRFRRQLQQRRHDWMSAARGSTGSNAVDVHTEPSPEVWPRRRLPWTSSFS